MLQLWFSCIDAAYLFIDSEKVPINLATSLKEQAHVDIKAYEDIIPFLQNINHESTNNKKIWIDGKTANLAVFRYGRRETQSYFFFDFML